jgi:hypothetical protein
MKSFKQFNEEKKKEVVFTFGRFNPPTIGHGKLLAKVAAAAIGNDYRIYASQSSDPKKNPLEYKEKIKVMRKMFPNHGRNIVEDKNAKTALHIASILYDQGFTKITMVVGSDRIKEFQKLLTTYNGVKGRHGYYDFKDGTEVISAGERDPDAEGVSGMSASKMRQAASEGDFKSFMMGIPKAYGEHKTLFNLVRKRMGLKEKNNFREHIELPSLSETRERYIAGEIFNEGDTVYAHGKVEITIQERKSNYVVCSKGNKYFIHSLEETLEFGTDKSAKSYKKDTPGQLSEKQIKGLEKKSEESGIAYSILKSVFDRGMGAYKTSHRPGTTPQQWAFARVNSFITGGKTRTTTDKDLWAKHKGSIKESKDFEPHWMYDPKTGEKEKAEKPEDHERLAAKGWVHESIKEGEGKHKGETWEQGYERRVVKTTDPNHLEKGFNWRIKGKERAEISIKLYKQKPDFAEYKKQMKRVAGHEFGK